MKGLLERLAAGERLVADGAMGTMLIDRGLEPGTCLEALNLSHPEVLEDISRMYLQAGAELIQTNTFGGSPLKLAQYGLEAKTEEINRAAVRAARKVVGDRAYVSGSCGPSGKMLKPYGGTEPDTLFESFCRQMSSLIEAGTDVICVETMIDIAEATLAVKAARDVAPSIPVMATMTFEPTPKGFHTIMGISIEQAARHLGQAGADVVGSNCGNGIENMIKVAQGFHTRTDLPLLIQSNAGMPEMKDGKLVYSESPEFMAEKARELIAAGVSIIGGCCGTTPDHIRALRKVVDST